MSRYLALGLSLGEVVTATTSGPAAILGRPELGTLRAGSPADVSVLRHRRDAGRAPGFAGGSPDRADPGSSRSRRSRAASSIAPPRSSSAFALSRRRPGGRLLGPDLRVGVRSRRAGETTGAGCRRHPGRGGGPRRSRSRRERDEVGVAADAARLVERVRPGRVQLAERRPRLAGVTGQADADASLRGVLVAIDADDRPGAQSEELDVRALERRSGGSATRSPPRPRRCEKTLWRRLVLADDRQEPAVVQADHVDVAVIAAVLLGDDRRRLEVLARRRR